MAASSRTFARLLPVLSLALLAPVAASAAMPDAIFDPDPTPASQILGAPSCVLAPGPSSGVSYVWTRPDAFAIVAQRIPACEACGPSSDLELEQVSIRVRWFSACSTAAARVMVVRAKFDTCPGPDTTQVRFGPVVVPLYGAAAQGEIEAIPLPPGWCVSPGDYVVIRLIDLLGCEGTTAPGLTRTNVACVRCEQYVATHVAWPDLINWCLSSNFSLWVQLQASCCSNVGVEDGLAPPRALGVSMLGAPARPVRLAVTLEESRDAELDVFDLAGRRVRTLLRARLHAGEHVIEWDGRTDAGSPARAGVYSVRLRSGTSQAVGTAILLD